KNDAAPAVNYRDLFPKPPAAGTVRNCAEAGVLGVVPGIVGALQANEVIKILTGIGEVLNGKLLNYDALQNGFYELIVPRGTDARRPRNITELGDWDYEDECGLAVSEAEITFDELDTAVYKSMIFVDIRDIGEQPRLVDSKHIEIPMGELTVEKLNQLETDTIVFCCQSGMRSRAVVQQFRSLLSNKKLFSLKGGVKSIPLTQSSKNYDTNA
ncbi:MAG: hypothetical protein H7Y31_05030, partial [Chitinophagaceae bacterium]|nr:hypothetical protein [Chitinophagaceae bacterium]